RRTGRARPLGRKAGSSRPRSESPHGIGIAGSGGMTADGIIRGTTRAGSKRRPVLITGGAGFIGCNLADRLAREGHDVLVYDALMRPGVDANLAWLKQRHPARISAVGADVRDETA